MIEESEKTKSIKLAIYKDLDYGWLNVLEVSEYHEGKGASDKTRVSAILEITFPEVPEADIPVIMAHLEVSAGKMKQKAELDIADIQRRQMGKDYIASVARNDLLRLPPPLKVNPNGSLEGSFDDIPF